VRPAAAALACSVLAALPAGCSALDPFPTLATNAEPNQPAGARVGICYNRLTTTLAEVQVQAQQQCPAGTTAERVDTDWYLQYCPLLLPARGTFVCTATK
jgi:hypothetical protein